MFAKCQYLDELTGGKGVTFATGTPISNSMTELYTNMRYLQYGTLQKLGLGHFDSWASSFGETQTAIELAPEGTGYRAKTRFAKFFNLPELIALFKESADIQTPDMLNLPVPEAEYENVVLKPSEYQKDMVASLAERAEAVRDRQVQPYEDNMLKITNDGRKLALDQRLINDMLPDDENSKASNCVEKAFEIWEQTKEQKSTQLIFCDLSTPKGDGTFNVYEDIRNKLIEKGVPPEEIAFIHEANTELRKAELFGKVRITNDGTNHIKLEHMPENHREVTLKRLMYPNFKSLMDAALKISQPLARFCDCMVKRYGFENGKKGCIRIINCYRKKQYINSFIDEAIDRMLSGEPQKWNSNTLLSIYEEVQKEAVYNGGKVYHQSEFDFCSDPNLAHLRSAETQKDSKAETASKGISNELDLNYGE